MILRERNKGESYKVYALRNLAAAVEANGRIVQCRESYEDIRKDFGAPQS